MPQARVGKRDNYHQGSTGWPFRAPYNATRSSELRESPLQPDEFIDRLAAAEQGFRIFIDCSGEGPELESALTAVADNPTAANIQAARIAFTTQQANQARGSCGPLGMRHDG